MNDVFISYSRRDKAFTQKLYEALKGVNRTVWADWDSIPAASDWFAEIKEGIEQTESVLFLLSPEWIKSNECRKELTYAVEMGKRLFPILWQPVDPKDVPPELARINWVYMREGDDFDKAFQTLCSAMDTDLEWIKTHTRIQVRALEWEKKKGDHSFVLRSKDLADAEQFIAGAAGKSPEPTALQGEYILASRKDATRRQRLTLTGVTAALVISIALGVVALFQRQAALTALARSESLRMAAEANTILSDPLGNPETAALLSLGSLQNDYYPQADAALVESISHLYTERVLEYGSQGDGNAYTSVAIVPDGKTVAIASNAENNTKVGLYDFASGKTIQTLQFDDDINGIAISPDGKYLAVADRSGIAKLVDMKTGKKIREFSGHTDNVSSIAFSPDGKYLLTGSWDDTARLWDLSSGKTVKVFSGNTSDVISVAFSPDGSFVFTGSWDNVGKQWDVNTGSVVGSVQEKNQILSISVSPAGKLLVTVTDRRATVWDLTTHQPIYDSRQHPNWVNSVVFSPDGRYFVTGGDDNIARIWDVKTGQMKRALVGHSGKITSVAYSPDGRYVVTGGIDGTARVWNADFGYARRILQGHLNTVTDVAVSPDGKTIITGSQDENMNNNYKLWDVQTGKQTNTLVGHFWLSSSVSFSKDGRYILTSNGDGSVRIWDAKTAKNIRTIQVVEGQWVDDAAFSPDGKYILAGSDDGTATLWDAETGSKLLTMNHPDQVRSVSISPDGKFALTGCRDNNLRLWDLGTGELVRTFTGHTQPLEGYLAIESVAFSPDGKYIVSASVDRTARLWDVATGEAIRIFQHDDLVLSTAISPDGKYVLTSSADRIARLWDLQTGELVRTFTGHKDSVFGVAFSPDGKFVVTASADTTARIWDTDYHDTVSFTCSLLVRELSPTEQKIYVVADTSPVCP